MKELKDLQGLIDKCVLCGGCHPDCPTYRQSRYEHDAARGKVVLAAALLKGELEATPQLAETFDHCLTCMACAEACPAGANPAKVITAARNELRKKVGHGFLAKMVFTKLLPEKAMMPILAAAMKLGTFLFRRLPWMPPGMGQYVREGKKRAVPDFSLTSLKSGHPAVISPKGTAAARVAYFTGCMANWVFKDSGNSVIEILASAGAEVLLVPGEVCCGAPAYFSGDMDSAERMARRNIALFAEGNPDYIVTSCATCGSVLKGSYPELVGGAETQAFADKIIDFQELLADKLIADFPAPKTGEKKLRVTYHDPCHLSRGMKVVKEPRELLKKLPGVEYIEMREANACCGGAGLFSAKFYADALEIGKRKALNIQESGADIVVTACPSCQMQLLDVCARYAPGVRVLHTAQLLAELSARR